MKIITTEEILKFKRPKLKFKILDVFKKRFSPRFFSEEEVKEKDLQIMFEAVRWTPSAHNAQPWHFYWTKRDSDSFGKICSSLADFNSWAKKAAVFIIACYIDKENPYALYDLGAAVITLIIQAQELGYYARQMGLFDKDKIKKTLPINETHTPFVIIALGKLGDYKKIDEELLQRELQPRIRKMDLARKV